MLSFEPLLKKLLLTPLKFLIICLAVLVPIVNAINILTHGFGCNIGFIFLVFLFSELFGTRAYALVQITQKEEDVVENNRIINHASWENPSLPRLLLRRDHVTAFYHVLE